MSTDLKTRLNQAQLKELNLISAIIAKGESPSSLNRAWQKFVKQSKDQLSASYDEDNKVSINEIIQYALSETYHVANSDLQVFAHKVQFLSDMKKQIHDEIARTRKSYDDYIKDLEDKLVSIGDDAQLANIDLQNMLQKQQQTIQMLSNVSKVLHDTALSVIRKIG